MSETLHFPARADVLRQLRADVRKATERLGGDESVGDVVALVVDELVNNAIEHGAAYRRLDHDLRVTIDCVAGRWRLSFFDPEMPGSEVAELALAIGQVAQGMPSLESERGRGLFLLSVYLEDLVAELDPTGGLRLAGFVARS